MLGGGGVEVKVEEKPPTKTSVEAKRVNERGKRSRLQQPVLRQKGVR